MIRLNPFLDLAFFWKRSKLETRFEGHWNSLFEPNETVLTYLRISAIKYVQFVSNYEWENASY